MKKVVKQTAMLLMAAFLLVSCSNETKNNVNAEVKPTLQPTAAATQETAVTPVTEVGTEASPSLSPQPSPTETAAAGSTAPEAGKNEEIPILYHMNKNYDLIPNEESTPKKVVLLTFDDGPKEADMINSMMDTMDKYNAKAIFFVNGYRVQQHPELLKLIHDRGGIIGNHSWDHIVLKDKSYATVKQQLEDVQNIVKEITGDTPNFFRPPHGAGGDVGKKVAAENNMLYMNWSVGSLDYEMKETETGKTEKLIKNVTDQLHSGSNILMHELPWTVEALDDLLSTLQEKGYGFIDPRSIEVKSQ